MVCATSSSATLPAMTFTSSQNSSRTPLELRARTQSKESSMKTLLLVMLIATVLQAQNPVTPVSITDADEIRAGQVLAEQFEQGEGMRPTPQTTKIDKYLQTVGDTVAAHAQRKLPYRFRFDPNPAFKSAVALPGGQIYVGGGILAYLDSEDQLAAVLGHEVEHVALSQCRDRLGKVLVEKH